MFEYLKKYWIKSIIFATVVIFFVVLGYDLYSPSVISSEINFYFRAIALAISAALIIFFTKESYEALADGAITSPKGLILGIWVTYLGIFFHIITEEFPEAIVDKIEHIVPLYEHDNSFHWIHHMLHGIIHSQANMVGSFLVILGSFLILLSAQLLNKKSLLWIVPWIAFVIAASYWGFYYIILPYAGL